MKKSKKAKAIEPEVEAVTIRANLEKIKGLGAHDTTEEKAAMDGLLSLVGAFFELQERTTTALERIATALESE